MKRSPKPVRGLSRIEREDATRSARARSHYARMRGQKKRLARQRLALGCAFALSFVAGIAVGGLRGDALLSAIAGPGDALSTIAIMGARTLDAREVAAATGLAPGTPLQGLEADAVAARVAEHPWVRLASARRTLRGVLVVGILEREPAALLHAARADEWRLVEADGSVFARGAPEDHPELVRLRTTQAAADTVDPRIPQALALAQSAERRGLGRPAGLALPEDGDARGWVLRFAKSDPEVVIGRNELETRLARYAQLRSDRPDALDGAVHIDLRFRDRAIVRAADGTVSAPRADEPSADESEARDGEADAEPHHTSSAAATAAAKSVTPDRLDSASAAATTERLGGTGLASG